MIIPAIIHTSTPQIPEYDVVSDIQTEPVARTLGTALGTYTV